MPTIEEYNYKGYTIESSYNDEAHTVIYSVYDSNGNDIGVWFDSLNDAKHHIDHTDTDNGKV